MTASASAADGTARLPGAHLKELSRIEPARVARAVALDWAVIGAALAMSLTLPAWGVVLAAIVVANRQYALLLLVHEASHVLFSRDRERNDRMANWTCAYPIGITVERYRELHLDHHRHLGTVHDPDFDYYHGVITRGRLVWTIIAGAFGIRGILTLISYFLPRVAARYLPSLRDRPVPRATSVSRLLGIAAAQLFLLGVFTLAGQPLLYFAVWLAPLLTLVPLANQLRTIAEHASPDESPITRTILTGAAGRVLLAPVLFFYHHEHHLYPSVPFYHLPELHRRLRESGHFDERPPVLAPSYVATLTALSHGHAPSAPTAP